MKNYDHKKIEKKWQKEWEKNKIYQAKDGKGKKFYSLIEFPYPSAEGLHVGHPRPYIGMDVVSRKKRMDGLNVLFPIGWDAFGLPTENYAIKTGIHPKIITKKNTDNFRRQIKSLGISFDWSREINTTDPAYYKWTQWIFLQFYKRDLAYKAEIPINWCPKDKIGLANEEVIDGKCERCGTQTERRMKNQWMLGITKYAERLDKDLDLVDYPERVKLSQRNWIGKSEGSEIEFKIINPSPTLPEGKGENTPGYYTTDAKTWKLLQDKVLEMRKNPTESEEKLWQILRKDNRNHFRRQHIIDRFIADFVCLSKKLIIEIDGDIHDLQKERDKERTDILKVLGFMVLRFKNTEVLKDINRVIKEINKTLENPSLWEGQGWVLEGLGGVKVFTTRADTLFGVTYVVLAPEHPLVESLKLKVENKNEVEKYIEKVKKESELERTAEGKEKTGVELKGIKAINPANNEEIPIWIADYVLASYGTGAVMAVPQHDARDKEFAEKYNLPIVDKPLVDAEEITKTVGGKMVTKFKLRDWVFSRQRYWGEPIPVINCSKCGLVPVKEKDLPVKLPEVKKYKLTDTGESPLAGISKWVNTKCPKCGGKAKRETDTMPNWAGSSWYYLRYTDPKNKNKFASKANLKYWLQPIPNPFQRKGEKDGNSSLPFGEGQGGVDWYNGGMEHTTLHLLYSRFWHKFLYDLKLVPTVEPYKKRTSHGMVLGEGGVKMSKSLGNVINPDKIVKLYGADTLRVYEMFIGPFEDAVVWNTESIIGSRRFIEKVWRISENLKNFSGPRVARTVNVKKSGLNQTVQNLSSSLPLQKLLHKTIKKVSEDIEAMRFNTAISAMMILATEIEKAEFVDKEDFKKFLQILAPFAPHVTEEIWHLLGEKKSINLSEWPVWDESLIKDDEVKIAVQINGKTRAEIIIEADENEEEVKAIALKEKNIISWVQNKEIKKVIYVKNRIINIVI